MIEVNYIGAWQWHWSKFGILVNVSVQASEIFQSNRQFGYHTCERGGQLFIGIDQLGEFWLFATPPHSLDKSGRTWLELDNSRCKSEIIEANACGLRLVGYWHTHPQEVPTLSSQDVLSLTAFSDRNKDTLQNPLAVIVGRSSKKEGIRAWSHRSSELQSLAYHKEKP